MLKTPLYHLDFLNINTNEALTLLKTHVNQHNGDLKTVFFVNAHCFNVSLKDTEYHNALQACDVLLNDGIGIRIAGALKNVAIKENMNGTDFIPKIINLGAEEGQRVYLLGAQPHVIKKAAAEFQQRYPNLVLAGVHDGFFSSDEAMTEEIVKADTDILVVGMGVPKQETWLQSQRHALKGVKLAVAGGAIFDFTAGNVVRAPKFIQSIGMEWLFRLLQEPKRLFSRYVLGNATFLAHVIRNRKNA